MANFSMLNGRSGIKEHKIFSLTSKSQWFTQNYGARGVHRARLNPGLTCDSSSLRKPLRRTQELQPEAHKELN